MQSLNENDDLDQPISNAMSWPQITAISIKKNIEKGNRWFGS